MFVPSQAPQQLLHQKKRLGTTFSLLVWNVHKENMSPIFQKQLHTILKQHPSDFLLFQEYKHPKKYPCSLYAYSYALASNIETPNNFFGVMTASKVRFTSINRTISHKKELGNIATHKSLLITSHLLTDHKPLHIVNLHAINFVSLKSFSIELEKIEQVLQGYQGAIIIAGDFNNWSQKRVERLHCFQNTLTLKKAAIVQEHHIKQVFSKPLDHIFYRGVTLLEAEAIDTKKVSDHNPIFARFTI